MYTLATLVGIGFCVSLYLSWGAKFDEKFIVCFVGFLLSGVCSLAVSGCISMLTPTRDVVLGPATLVSMRTSDDITGAFIFGSGTIEGISRYNFMMKMDDGSFAPGWINADHTVRIIEDESLEGVGYWRTTVREPDSTSALYNWSFMQRGQQTIRQEFRVPAGSVVQGFKVQ